MHWFLWIICAKHAEIPLFNVTHKIDGFSVVNNKIFPMIDILFYQHFYDRIERFTKSLILYYLIVQCASGALNYSKIWALFTLV